jgi:chromosome partitioning protein
MDRVTYPRKRLAELLGLSDTELEKAETSGVLSGLGGRREKYGCADLSKYRKALGRYPRREKQRRQLFLNFKGGTGKTSLSVSYAHRLAELGHRVLLVDLDSQGHASKCLGFEGEFSEATLYDALVKKKPIEEIRVITALEELHLVPSNLRMATVDLALMPLSSREHKLKKALEPMASEYDFVVLDAPPAFGLLNLNAIVAADDLFVPVLPDFLSFHGLKLLFEMLDDIQEDLEHALDRIFVVINQFNPSTNIARTAREALISHYPEYLLPVVIRQCTKFAQASGEGTPIFAFDPTSKAAADVQALIDHTAIVTTTAATLEERAP